MGEAELADAASVPVVEGPTRIGRGWLGVAFENGHVVPVVGEHHRRCHPAHAAAGDDDLSHPVTLTRRDEGQLVA